MMVMYDFHVLKLHQQREKPEKFKPDRGFEP